MYSPAAAAAACLMDAEDGSAAAKAVIGAAKNHLQTGCPSALQEDVLCQAEDNIHCCCSLIAHVLCNKWMMACESKGYSKC